MRIKLFVFFAFVVFLTGLVSSLAGVYYKLDFGYGDNLELNGVDVDYDYGKDYSIGPWSALVYDYEGNILDSVYFNLDKTLDYEFFAKDGRIINREIEVDYINFSLFVPYYENASEVVIFNGSAVDVVRVDVSMYMKEGYENYLNKKKSGFSGGSFEGGSNFYEGDIGVESKNESEKKSGFERVMEGDFNEFILWGLIVVLVGLILWGIFSRKSRKIS